MRRDSQGCPASPTPQFRTSGQARRSCLATLELSGLCKGLAVVLVGGDIAVQILPQFVDFLALIPARKEPLLCKEYISKRPVIIPYHRGGKRLYIGYQEFAKKLATRSQAVNDHLYSIQVKVISACQSRKADSKDDEDETEQQREERLYGSLMKLVEFK